MPETLAAATVDRLLITRTFLHHRGPILQGRPSDHWQGDEAVEHSLRLFYLGLAIRNRAREILHEHAELVDALVAGDGPLARTIASEQIAAARTMVLDALVQSPSVVGVPISAPSSPRRVSSTF
jgi:DNA-binding GntR family transcriptional regulator